MYLHGNQEVYDNLDTFDWHEDLLKSVGTRGTNSAALAEVTVDLNQAEFDLLGRTALLSVYVTCSFAFVAEFSNAHGFLHRGR